MNKLALSFTLLIIVLVAGYIYYDKHFDTEAEESLWDYVPQNAMAVYEYQRPHQSAESNFPFQSIPWVKLDTGFFTSLGKLSLSSNELLVSAHMTADSDIGLIGYLNLKSLSVQEGAINLLNKIRDKSSKESKRRYNGYVLHEIKFKEFSITYVIENNVLIASRYGFLVEDVIRLKLKSDLYSFKDSKKQLMELPKLASDYGNLYLDVIRLNQIQQSIFSNFDSEPLANSTFLDLDYGDRSLTLNGFTISDQKQFLSIFNEQTPVKDFFNTYIPNSASTIVKYGISSPTIFHRNLINYYKNQNRDFLINRNDFEKKYSFDLNDHWKLVNGGLCQLNFYNGPNKEQLLMVAVNDVGEASNELNELAEKLASINDDSLYVENFGNSQIWELQISQFPEMVYGPPFRGFQSTYYTSMNNLIVFGTSIDILKEFTRSIENEETWGRTLNYNQFFSKGLEEINFSASYNLQYAWSRLVSDAHPKWRTFLKENQTFFKRFKLGTLQFSKVDDSYYTNLLISYDDQVGKEPIVGQRLDYKQRLSYTIPIESRPFVVKNHNTNLRETIIYDSLNHISLISNDGRNLWSKKLDQRIVAPIDQIDFYKNKKLQFFTATETKLHVIDRLGNNLENFPLDLPFKIKGAKVIDYDDSRNYRFMLTDELGNTYLTDKYGKFLNGWDPFKKSGQQASMPLHVRIRGKDCFVFLMKNGEVIISNRKGDILPKFPIKLDGRYNGSLFVKKGASFNNTELHVVSESGVFTKVSLDGEVMGSEQMYKQNTETTFKIIPDELGRTYLIARRDKNRLVLLDSEKKEILAKDYLGAEELLIQYYYFNPDTQIFSVTDPVQGFTYLYRQDGSLVSSQPLNSDKEVAILYSEAENNYTVWAVHDKTFSLIKF